jgi:hypothetical protein
LRDEIEATTRNIYEKTGFQYLTTVLDNGTAKFTSRTAYNGANDYHNANKLTYHEVKNIAAIIGSTRTSAVYAAGSWSTKVVFRVPSGTASADITDFTLRIDLAEIASDTWWTTVLADGGDIRATLPNGTELPIHLEQFCQQSRTGVLVVKTSITAAADLLIRVWCGNTAAKAYAVTDTYGRNAVYGTAHRMSLWTEARGATEQAGKSGALTPNNLGLFRGDDGYLMWAGDTTQGTMTHDADMSIVMNSTWTLEAIVEPTDVSGGDTFSSTNPKTIFTKGAITDNNYCLRLLGPKLEAVPFAKLTGWQGRTNEHGRDAAMLV